MPHGQINGERRKQIHVWVRCPDKAVSEQLTPRDKNIFLEVCKYCPSVRFTEEHTNARLL